MHDPNATLKTDSCSLPGRKTSKNGRNLAYYRTCNFAGLPKGSYCTPNPQHFHIVRQTRIAQPLRPILVKIDPPSRASHYVFDRFNVSCDQNKQTVTISIGNYRSVSLAMSLETINNFIRPFVDALNILGARESTHREVQTTYVLHQEGAHTPLIEDAIDSEKLDDSSFEKEILDKLKENLIADLTRSESEDDDDIVEFTEEDSLKINESLADAVAVRNFDDIEFPEDLFKISESFADVPHDLSNVSKRDLVEDSLNNNVSAKSSPSIDEGVADLKLSPPRETLINPDDNVIKLGKIIFDYMSDQGFEDSDLVIFPELVRDPNTVKLMNRLTVTYEELYGDKLTPEERSDLRLVISSYVLSLIEKDDRMASSTDSLEFPMVSDKLFSISETLSTIMDHFFEILDAKLKPQKNFEDFVHPFNDVNGNMSHSTPDPKINTTYEIVEEVTSFKKDQIDKPGHETYWFSIGSPRERKIVTRTAPKKIINVDEIPLPPPRDSSPKSKNSVGHLPPILEEASRNLLFDFMEDEKNEDVDVLAGGDSGRLDSILTGCSPLSYVAFEQPETNVVVCSGVTFNRTITTVASAYVKSDSVTFKRNNDEVLHSVTNLDNSDGEGDWMGYESAKF